PALRAPRDAGRRPMPLRPPAARAGCGRGSVPSSRARLRQRGGAPSSCRRRPLAQDLERRAREQPQVEAERPATRIRDVHVERFSESYARAGRQLPQTCEAGGYEEALEMMWREALRLVREAWARPDERHVAAEHVQKLR